MSSLDLYRARVPGHVAVDDAAILAALEDAATLHTAEPWGAAYALAMVWYAAHELQRTPGLPGIIGGGGAAEVGPLQSQKDDTLQRSFGSASAGGTGGGSEIDEVELGTTRYGMKYLRIRASRGVLPIVVS